MHSLTLTDTHLNINLRSYICGPISFKLCLMVEVSELCCLVPVWQTLTFIQSHSCMRKQNLWCSCSHTFFHWNSWNLMCCHDLLVCWNSHKIHVCTINIQRREACLSDFCLKNLYNTCLCLDSSSLVRDALNFTVWMMLTVIKVLWVTLKLKHVQSFCCKVIWSSSNLAIVHCVRELSAEKSRSPVKCGKHGSVEHLLFLVPSYFWFIWNIYYTDFLNILVFFSISRI